MAVNYENLKLFRDIAQTHSFSRGASMNGISQSAASQHVQELERSLAVELLDRSTRPLVVTPAGRLYGEFCRDILRRKEDFESGTPSDLRGGYDDVSIVSLSWLGRSL